MSGDLYRLIPEEGKHLADSHGTEGAVRGVYLDNETNKPCGAGEFIPVDEDEQNSEWDSDYSSTQSIDDAAGLIKLVIGIGVGVSMTKAYPYVKRWLTDTAIPEMKKFWSRLQGKAPEALEASLEVTGLAAEEFSENIDVVLDEYQNNMSSEEAQRHLLNIMYAAIYIASEIRQLSNSVMKAEERLEWSATLEKLTTQSVTDEINRILAENTQMLEGKQIDQFFAFVGETLVSGGAFVPIENSRFKEALEI